jgi:hypothetical protein
MTSSMTSLTRPAAPECAPLAPSSMVTLFGSTRRASGRVTLPAELELKVAFGELKLDLRDALLADEHVVLYCESLCASLEVLLPEGVTVADRSLGLMSSHKLSQAAEGSGRVVYLEGWSVCSDVKLLSAVGSGRSCP